MYQTPNNKNKQLTEDQLDTLPSNDKKYILEDFITDQKLYSKDPDFEPSDPIYID